MLVKLLYLRLFRNRLGLEMKQDDFFSTCCSNTMQATAERKRQVSSVSTVKYNYLFIIFRLEKQKSILNTFYDVDCYVITCALKSWLSNC